MMTIEEQLYQLKEDFKAFRDNITQRIVILEEEARPEVKAELRRIAMALEIEVYRHG